MSKKGKTMELLKLDQVTYAVGNHAILKGITLIVDKGDCISVVGGSGSGKSTFMKLCADLISPSLGEMFFEGKPYVAYDPMNIRKKISYVVQIPYLFGNTVYDNLSFPFNVRKEKPDQEKMKEWMQSLNLDESYLYKDINGLSGGEKQRICLIRNLIYKPDILLLDEATSALDTTNEKCAEKIVQKLNGEGVTIIWITHSLEQSESIFNRRLTMEAGLVIKEERISK